MSYKSFVLSFWLLAALVNGNEISNHSISHASASKNFANGRRFIGTLRGKIFDDKNACDEKLTSLSVPFVQVKRKSTGRFICNGLLISGHLVLTLSACTDEITNPMKFDVAYKQTNGSIRHHDISWTCKHPAWRTKRGRQREVALITLDKPLEARELTCFAGTKLDGWHGSASLTMVRMDATPGQAKPLLTDRLEAEPVSCSAGPGAKADDPMSVCVKISAQPKELCNTQAAMLLWRQTNSTRRLAMLTSAGKLDANNCLVRQQDGNIIMEMLDLTRFWLDGHLSVLVHHCSKSRKR